ncbi:MAG TPA: response regulator transcription factor [Ktedonobacterales bacterium]|nr:response regulator transcription factor [Ktedonobacterales bacterium]
MATILLVEDEVDLCNLIRGHLEGEGHTVLQAFDGITALSLVEQYNPHLLILDWMLPGLDGLTVCRRVRQSHLMPILMLTARSEEIDRVLGLEVGADDYVIKPFSMRELLARVRAMLRRVTLDMQVASSDGQTSVVSAPTTHGSAALATGDTPDAIICGPLRVDPTMHTAVLDGAELDLTPKEFELLQLFAAHPGRAFSREFLVERIWGYTYDGFDRTVDTHITRLRKKLGPLGEKIVTVWGVGYRLVL